MKKENILRTFIASIILFLAIPLPAYAISYCSLHPVLAILVLFINIGIIFLIFYYPFKLISKIKSEKIYPKFFKINRVFFAFLFLLQFIIPTALALIIFSLFPDFDSVFGISAAYIWISIPVLIISSFAIWVERRYGLKWGVKMLVIAFGAPLIYLIVYFSEEFVSVRYEGLLGAIQTQTEKIFPPQCPGDSPILDMRPQRHIP